MPRWLSVVAMQCGSSLLRVHGQAGSLINAWRQHARVQIAVDTGTVFDVHLAVGAAPSRVTGGGICAAVPCSVDFVVAHQLMWTEHQNFGF